MNKNLKNILMVIAGILVLVIIAVTAFLLYNKVESEENNDIAYTDLIKKIAEDSVEKIEMTVGSTTLKITLREDAEKYKAIIPNTQAFIELVQKKVEER